MGLYSGAGEIGISNTVYRSHWILVQERDIYLHGGYQKFGEFYIGEPGYTDWYVWKEGYDIDKIYHRWNNEMSQLYKLEKYEWVY